MKAMDEIVKLAGRLADKVGNLAENGGGLPTSAKQALLCELLGREADEVRRLARSLSRIAECLKEDA